MGGKSFCIDHVRADLGDDFASKPSTGHSDDAKVTCNNRDWSQKSWFIQSHQVNRFIFPLHRPQEDLLAQAGA